MHDRVSRLMPPSALGRALALRSGLYAVGTGVFLAGNAVFFTQIVGLSPGLVGLGISLAGVVSVLSSVPTGRIADRIGNRRAWALAGFGEALTYLAYPWVRGLTAFVVVVVVLALMESMGRAARGAYTLAVVPRGDRVLTLAFVRSALNIGFSVGALLSGLALSTDSRRVILAIPLVTCAILLVNALMILPMPDSAPDAEHVELHGPGAAAMRNRPFMVLAILSGQLGVNQVLLAVVFPLWLVERTDAPHWMLAWLYGTNTVLAVLLQVAASRGAESIPGALRAGRWGAVGIALSCVLVMATAWTHHWETGLLLWVGYVALTAGELFASASSWGLIAELTDPARRGEYQGAWRLGIQVQMVVGPVLFTAIAVTWRPAGMLVVAGWALLCAVLMPRFAYAAQRLLATASGRA